MFSYCNVCHLCLNTYKDLKTILTEDNEGIAIQKKVKYCLPEIVDSHLDILKHICKECSNKIDSFYIFKQSCLQNNINLKKYLQDETHKHISLSNDQILSIGNEAKEDTRTTFNNEIRCTDVLNIKVSHSVFEAEKQVTVKEEYLSSEDSSDDNGDGNGVKEFYHEFVKCETVPNNSEAYYSGSEDVFANSNSNENNTTNPEEENVTIEKTRFQCAVCNKTYLHKQSLEYHLKVHAGIKNFSCPICNEKFLRKSHLNEHEKIHIGIKNYECPICKKKFLRKSNLNSHGIIHSGVKNFECPVCQKKFMLKSNMMKHEKRHTGLMNIECPTCQKRFTQKRDLIQHEKIHTGIKNFECSICKKKFMRKGELMKHEKRSLGKCNLAVLEKVGTSV